MKQGRNRLEINENLISKDYKKIKQQLERKYENVIQKYKYIRSDESAETSNVIWMCWWQGLENAPEIVKNCFKSIKRFSGSREIKVINKENYKEYIDIPDYIEKKLENKIISITHFSDILRINLLSRYGGTWIDATCFLTGNIFDNILSEFYSVKLPFNEKEICVSRGKWCVFFMSGKKNNTLFNFANDFYKEYWRKEDTIIDYYLLDYIIDIAYDNLRDVKVMIDKVPENNILIHQLKEQLNNEYNEVEYKQILKYNMIHKLAHEKEYIKRLKNGKETFYGHIF